MRLYTDPTYNKVAPNTRARAPEFVAEWTRIAKHGGFPDPARGSFEFWFNYFWSEAVRRSAFPNAGGGPVAVTRGDLTEAEKVALSEAWHRVFEFVGTPPQPRARATVVALTDREKFAILRALLLVGFKRVPLSGPRSAWHGAKLGGATRPEERLAAVPATELQVVHTLAALTGDNRLPLAFRSDDRTYEELMRAEGFHSRARQPHSTIQQEFGLDKAWHPYANPVYQDSLWLRLGATNKDNCLHTVVSVGTRLEKITHFPILGDAVNVFPVKDDSGTVPLALKWLDEWTATDVERARTYRMATTGREFVRAVRAADGTIDHLEKTVRIHVVHLRGIRGYDTERHFGGSDPFPERAVSHVPMANFLAELSVVQRYWFNPGAGALKLYEVVIGQVRLVPDEATVRALLGLDGINSLRTILTGATQVANDGAPANERRERTAWQQVVAHGLSGPVQRAIADEIRRLRRMTGKPNRAAELPEVLKMLAARAAQAPGRFVYDEAQVRALDAPRWSTLAKGERLY
jgi:hypothetical protein